jgi:GNAT superfamily N-acetyltransferase
MTIDRTSEIRLLNISDIPAAVELSSAAGWNQTPQDWETLIKFGPEGCFALACDGEVASTTTLVRYGGQLAWLGMVLTRPAYRRRGFARLLVNHALRFADESGIETVKLDATEQGMQLYASFGFDPEQPVERWSSEGKQSWAGIPGDIHSADRPVALLESRTTPPTGSALYASGSLPASSLLAACRAMGDGRGRLLSELARKGGVMAVEGGYLLHRPGRLASYMGPCVASQNEIAGRLIASCLATNNGQWYWDLLPEQGEATALAKRFGFAPERRLVRMFRGRAFRSRDEIVYAIAGFEWG